MCRMFGMSTGQQPARATFWLLEAPDSLSQQSRKQPDGTGLGWIDDDGLAWVDKAPMAAWKDAAFALEAREIHSANFVAHVRYATTGGLSPQNTHPFIQAGRLMAHNGVVGDLDRLEQELGDYRELVHGDTDSERYFALITKEVDAHDGDVGAGIAAAANWIARELPVVSLNIILAAGDEQWALRYPEKNPLYMLERAPGTAAKLDRTSRIQMRCEHLAELPAVIFATEPMDDDPGWRMLEPGQLVHVDGSLAVTSQIALRV